MSTIEKRDEAIDLARYKQAAEEIETGNRDDALWYKAFAEGGGDEKATKATYIRLRVEQLRRTAQQDAKNLYGVLGITKGASDEQILAGYQKQKEKIEIREGKDAEANNKLIFIKHAKEVLLDPVKRAAYDARITAEAAQPEKIGQEKISGNNKASASKPLSNRDLYAAYLGGKNRDYYLNKFEEFDRLGDGMHISWNWPAFITFLFSSAPWALYRKIYGWFFALFIFGTILFAMANLMPVAVLVVSVLTSTAVGMFANVIYYRRVKAKITDAKSVARSDDELIELLRKKGGIHSWVWWILWVWLVVAVVGIIAAIAIPAYSNYTKKAKAVGARPMAEQLAVQPPANDQPSKMEQPSVEAAKSMLVGHWICKYEQGEYVGKAWSPYYRPNFTLIDYGGSSWDILPDGSLYTTLEFLGSSLYQLNWITPTEFVQTEDNGPQAPSNRYSVARCFKSTG